MSIRFFFLLSLFLLTKCSPAPQEKSERDVFSTTAPSKLYFKNIRSTYYQQQQQKGTKVDLYQLRKIPTVDSRPIIYPVIADDWLNDKAFILLQTNDYKDGIADPLSIYWENGQIADSLKMGTPTFPEQLKMATKINELLANGIEIYTQNKQSERIMLFENYADKSNFMTIMRDYFKLVESEL